MKFSKILGSIGVFSVVLLGSSAALAEYVCNVTHVPGPTSRGSDGYVHATYYTAANCTGSFVGTLYYCSASPTSTSCANSTAYRYESGELVGLAGSLQRAAAADQLVTVWWTGCITGGSGSCGAYVGFNAN